MSSEFTDIIYIYINNGFKALNFHIDYEQTF